jgi:histidyl-tRNA synthetase
MRARKFSVAMDHEGRSLKSQMKQANKAGARFVLIVGDAELASGKGILRNMQGDDEQVEIPLAASAMSEFLAGKLSDK